MNLGLTSRIAVLFSLASLAAVSLTAISSSPAFASACGSGTAYSGGGTPGDPYVISEAAHLIYLSQTVSDWGGKHFLQTEDIDLGGCDFSPIGIDDGFAGPYFGGTYDGGGKTISGLFISHTDPGEYAGLFGATNGNLTITNLGLVDVNVSTSGGKAAGALLGYANYGSSAVTIRNTFVSGTVSASTPAYAGGLVGELRGNATAGNFSLLDSYSLVEVTGPNGAGGIVGNMVRGRASLTNVYSAGLITRVGGDGPQGLVGNDSSSGSFTLTVADTFWDSEATGAATGWPLNPDVGLGKTGSEMRQLATFTNWDIVDGWEGYNSDSPTNEWGICSTVNAGYPFLLWQFETDPCSSSGGEAHSTTAPEKRASAPAIHLDLQVSVGQQLAGAPVVIGGEGLAGGSSYTFIVRSTPQTVDSGTASALGNFSKQVSMPALAPGSHTLTLTAIAPDGSALSLVQGFAVGANGTVTALGSPAGSVGSALAATGSDQFTMLWSVGLAMLLLVAGVSAVAMSRARQGIDAR